MNVHHGLFRRIACLFTAGVAAAFAANISASCYNLDCTTSNCCDRLAPGAVIPCIVCPLGHCCGLPLATNPKTCWAIQAVVPGKTSYTTAVLTGCCCYWPIAGGCTPCDTVPQIPGAKVCIDALTDRLTGSNCV